MHAVRIRLLQEQAERIGLPLTIIELPCPCSNTEYPIKITQGETVQRDNFIFTDWL